jgi:hypothetical protein
VLSHPFDDFEKNSGSITECAASIVGVGIASAAKETNGVGIGGVQPDKRQILPRGLA